MGQSPKSRPQARNLSYGLSLVLSLAYCSKERTERIFSMLHVLTFYPLFSLTPQAQEKSLAKKKRRDKFAPAGATRALPSTREPLKRLERNFHPARGSGFEKGGRNFHEYIKGLSQKRQPFILHPREIFRVPGAPQIARRRLTCRKSSRDRGATQQSGNFTG